MDILWTVLSFCAGILVVFVICKILSTPLKVIGKLIVNALIGAVVLIVFNFIGGKFGFSIAVNPITALATGVLGAPGVILMLVLQWLL